MELSDAERALLHGLAEGLPLTPRPFADLARALGTSEEEVIARIRMLRARGAIKRLGIVVRHRELGYVANAMVVFDVPDAEVDTIGERMSALPFVTLCYRRRRAGPQWPYNLFAMIHGTAREIVNGQIASMVATLSLQDVPRAVLFSRRRFKQRGARYAMRRGGADAPVPTREEPWTRSTAAS